MGSDLLLAGAGLIGLVFCGYLIFFGEFTPETSGLHRLEPVAQTTSLLGEVRRRPHATLAWDGLRFGAALHQQDTVFVPDDGELLLAFQDGSELHIEENSLVVIIFRPEPSSAPEESRDDPNSTAIDEELQLLLAEADLGLTVEVVRGGVSGRNNSEKGSITIKSKNARTRLRNRGEARVRVRKDASAQVHVVSGEATVSSGGEEHRVGAQTLQGIGAEGGLSDAAVLGIPLLKPAVGERVWVRGGSARLAFEWEAATGKGPYFLQLAKDSEFEETVARARSRGTSAELRAPQPGVYFWRVGRRGEAGALRSEERRLIVIEDTPPALLEPRNGEIVYVPGGGAVAFNWGAVPHAQGYRLRLTRDRKLEDPVFDLASELPSHWQSTENLPEGVYYWSVRIDDPAREKTPWASVMAFRLITRPLPEPPRLFDTKLLLEGAESAPSDEQGSLWPLRWLIGPAVARAGGSKTKHRLRWSAVPGIETYEVEIAEDQACKKVIHRTKVEARYLEWKPPSLEKDFWYRVRSIDPEGRPGKYAKPKIIRAPNRGPAPLGPPGGQRTVFGEGVKQVRLAWAEVPGTTRYEVQVSRGSAFAKIEASLGARGETQVPWELPGPGLFFWRARAIDAAGRTSVWGASGKIDVRLARPELRAPRAGATISLRGASANVKLVWKSGPSKDHQIQLSRVKGFGSTLASLEAREETTIYRTRKTGRYFWRARSRDSAGRWSGWSKVGAFSVIKASLVVLTPADGAVFEFNGAPEPVVLTWEAVPRAKGYRVKVVPAEGTMAKARKLRTPTPSLSVPDLAEGSYGWSVVALSPKGTSISNSSERAFQVVIRAPLVAPELARPEDGVTVTGSVATFGWGSVADALRYQLTVSLTQTGNLAHEEEVSDLSATVSTLAPGAYTWRVRAVDETSQRGAWSQPRSFTATAKVEERVGPVESSSTQTFASFGAGGTMTLGADFAWQAGLGLGHRPPWLEGRTFLELAIHFGQHGSALSSSDGAVTGRATLRRLPISARMGLSLTRSRFHPQVSFAFVTEPYWAAASVAGRKVVGESGVLVGGQFGFGLEGRVGPGHLVLGVDLTQMVTQSGAFEVGGTSLAAHLGYRWRIH